MCISNFWCTLPFYCKQLVVISRKRNYREHVCHMIVCAFYCTRALIQHVWPSGFCHYWSDSMEQTLDPIHNSDFTETVYKCFVKSFRFSPYECISEWLMCCRNWHYVCVCLCVCAACWSWLLGFIRAMELVTCQLMTRNSESTACTCDVSRSSFADVRTSHNRSWMRWRSSSTTSSPKSSLSLLLVSWFHNTNLSHYQL